MKVIILLSTLVAIQAASVSNSCTVSQWGDWKETLPHSDRTGKTIRNAEHMSDEARAALRHEMMEMRQKASLRRQACLAEGTCPQFMARNSEGPIACTDGIIDSPTTTDDILCLNINQESFTNFDDLLSTGFTEGNDVWGWTSAAGAEIAIMGMTTGSTFVDISNPRSPIVIAFLPTATFSSTWRDMKVVNDWAFIVSEASNHGIQAFNLNRLATITPGSVVDPDYVIGAVGNCHNIASNPATNKILGVGCTAGTHCAERGGLYIVDVSDPANPIIPDTGFNCYDGDGYVHDVQCVVYAGPDTAYTGRDICFSYNEDTFTIVDVTVPNDIVLVSRTGYIGSSYTHQGWVTEDHTVVLLDDELDESNGNGELRTYIWDVTDLDAPVLRNTHYHGLQSIDHNQYIVGDYTYQADYMTGLQVLRIDKAAFTLERVGYFDVFPTSDLADFYGSWSVYPYFASGNIVISSIDYGMYVVSTGEFAQPKDAKVERQRYRTILNAGNGVCPSLVQTEQL